MPSTGHIEQRGHKTEDPDLKIKIPGRNVFEKLEKIQKVRSFFPNFIKHIFMFMQSLSCSKLNYASADNFKIHEKPKEK